MRGLFVLFQSRLSILCVHTRQMPLDDVCLSDIAGRTDGFTGADLENLCREVSDMLVGVAC